MSQTNVSFDETDLTCDHCHGRILKRVEALPDRTSRTLLQCERCRCQWTADRQRVRAGTQLVCRTAAQAPQTAAARPSRRRQFIPLIVMVLALIAVLAYGGMPVIMQVLPGLVGAFAFLTVLSFGREQRWW